MASDLDGQISRILEEIGEISEGQARMEEKLDSAIERGREDRACIAMNTNNITALRIEQAKIGDRQRGLTALSSVLATVISTTTAVAVSIFGAKS